MLDNGKNQQRLKETILALKAIKRKRKNCCYFQRKEAVKLIQISTTAELLDCGHVIAAVRWLLSVEQIKPSTHYFKPPHSGDSVLNRFMTLGVTAAVAITVGSIVIFIVCIVAIICCCKKSACKKADPNSITTTATSVVTNGGVTPFQGKINKANPPAVFTHAHQGYHPIQPSVPAIGPAYTPLTRESYTQSASPYSSQPTSCHRSATPTSSKSAKSNRSNQSVTFSQVGTNYVNSSQGRTTRNPLQIIQEQTLSHPNQAFNYSCQIYK
ncbi:protein shisa-5 [Octopus sinensis]|uniref:Protein shisa-5 n=1 Tax=Octopus sinensis TaxID=2607531 RepID=A0A6P7T9N2_9MOLL|nr:protein shisa-5 [Octopus sinensis]